MMASIIKSINEIHDRTVKSIYNKLIPKETFAITPIDNRMPPMTHSTNTILNVPKIRPQTMRKLFILIPPDYSKLDFKLY